MGLWHFTKSGKGLSWKEGDQEVSSFDDGLCLLPSEEGFSREAADAKAVSLGKGVVAELTGVPGWHARIDQEVEQSAIAEEQARKRASAEAEIDTLMNPRSDREIAVEQINGRFDALLAAAPDREADIEQLRKRELDALEG